MNYIRGAFNAATSYYGGINPSTLTGAIDVIVIERPVEGGKGETELVCSPFHVRFGKWQVLRPGEKKVNVLVNGQSIPFHMKIGDAGEAFFVFETEDEVPEELLTSPILEPTKPSQVNEDVPTGRFGSKEVGDDTLEEPSRSDHIRKQASDADVEPSFLDLASSEPRASSPEPSEPSSPASRVSSPTFRSTSNVRAASTSPPTSVSHSTSPSRESTSDSPNELRDVSRAESTSKATSPSTLLAAGREKGRATASAIAHAPSAAAAQVFRIGDAIMDTVAQPLHLISSPNTNPSNPPEVDPVPQDSTPEAEAENESPAHTPVYGHDVVMDMAGYHSKGEAAQAEEEDADHADEKDFDDFNPLRPDPLVEDALSEVRHDMESGNGNARRASLSLEAESSHPKAPPSLSTRRQFSTLGTKSSGIPAALSRRRQFPRTPDFSHLPTTQSQQSHYPFPTSAPEADEPTNHVDYRATPEPPEIAIPSPSLPASDEYSWEWGNFPQRSPAITKFPALGQNLRAAASSITAPPTRPDTPPRKIAERAVSEPPQSDVIVDDSFRSKKEEPEDRGFGTGGRLRPDEDGVTFHMDIEGQKYSFQLSLCGPLDGVNEVEDGTKFENAKVTYAQFIDDPAMPESDNLVILWGDKYISQRDSSPLMPALSIWRETAAQPTRPSSPTSIPRLPQTISQPSIKHSRGSSWAAWWGRSRAEQTELPSPASVPDIPALDKPRPVLPPAAQTDPEVLANKPLDTPTSPPRSPSVTPTIPEEKKHYVKTLRLTSDQLKQLNLKKGPNTITFSLTSSGVAACTARIFVWDSEDHIVVSDIDGTITKSDALGHVFTMIGRDWTHLGVAKLYTDIAKNGYKIMYLTSRAIGQADSTRDYLKGIKQNNYQLPEGPVIMSPDRLMASLHREVIMRKPEVFKMACLRDIQRLFGPNSKGAFYAGFGNRITDALSYRSVNIPSSRIFTIDSTGEVKMELLELAGYKSSYIHMTDLVDQMFPPVHRKLAAEFTDFNFWRQPVAEFELPNLDPPSPALSARSDTSRLSRLRNFSLRSSSPPVPGPADQVDGDEAAKKKRASSPLASPVLTANDPESYSDGEDGEYERRYARRDRRMSMPGSIDGGFLDDPNFGAEFEHGSEDGEYDEEGQEEDMDEDEEGRRQREEEATFDDDLLATGEMDNIPFL